MKLLITFLYFISLGLLAFDSVRSHNSSIKYLGIDSHTVAIIFLIFIITLALKNIYPFSKRFLKVNTFIFWVTSFFSVIFILLDYFLYHGIIFHLFSIQIENIVLIPIVSGAINYISYSSRISKQLLWKKLIYLLPPLELFFLIFVDVFDHKLFKLLIKEDGFFENLQFLFYFLASVFSISTASIYLKKNEKLKSSLFFILGIGLFFIAAEEISWGQRLIGFHTPDFVYEKNLQGEFNIHNQGVFHRYTHIIFMIVGLWGALGRIVMNKFLPQKFKLFYEVTPPTFLFFYFFSTFMFYFLNQYLRFYYEIITINRIGMGQWQEVAEFYLSLGFLLFTLITYYQHKKQIKGS